jgi:hypothetical protein
MDRVACGLLQPVLGFHTGSLRVTRQLMRRLDRIDRLSVARIFTARKVMHAGRLG